MFDWSIRIVFKTLSTNGLYDYFVALTLILNVEFLLDRIIESSVFLFNLLEYCRKSEYALRFTTEVNCWSSKYFNNQINKHSFQEKDALFINK